MSLESSSIYQILLILTCPSMYQQKQKLIFSCANRRCTKSSLRRIKLQVARIETVIIQQLISCDRIIKAQVQQANSIWHHYTKTTTVSEILKIPTASKLGNERSPHYINRGKLNSLQVLKKITW